MCDGVLRNDSADEYTLLDEAVWITVKKRFSVKIHVTDEGIVCDIFSRGHEDEGAIASTYAFDTETECDCEEHPWNKEG